MLRRPSSLVLSALLIGVAFGNRSPRNFGSRSQPAVPARSRMCPQLPVGSGPNAADDGMVDFQVTVTPTTNPDSADANWSSNTGSFTVKNTGGCTDTYTYSATPGGAVTGVTLNYTGTTLPPGYSQVVTATYSVGNSPGGTGSVTLTASGTATGRGTFSVTVRFNGPIVSTLPTNGDYRDVTKCVAKCFDAVASYVTPPYFSADQPHSVRLTYRSAQAHAMGLVEVNAKDTATVNPVKMSIQLKNSQGANVTFTNGTTEMFFNWALHGADSVNRLSAQFDASTFVTGDSTYTALVRSYRSDGSFRENDVPVRILIVNEANSPFGAGWTIEGLQHGYAQGDGSVVVTEGNGSAAYFRRDSTRCAYGTCNAYYTSPTGDFSTFTKDSVPGVSVSYVRAYPAGPIVTFDANLKMSGVGGWLLVLGEGRANEFRLKPGIFHIGGATFSYNASNLLVAINDSTGNTDSLGYDASNHLRWIKDPGGRTDSITINASGDLTQIKDWAGGVPFSQGSYGVGTGNELDNDGCKVDIVGWHGMLGSEGLTSDNTYSKSGGSSCKVTTANANWSGHWISQRNGTRPSVMAGQSYTHSFWLYSDGAATGKVFVAGMYWYNNSGGFISGPGAGVTLVTGWQRVSFTATAPAGAVTGLPVFATSGAQGSFSYWVDGATFTGGTSHQLMSWIDRRGGSWNLQYDFAGKATSAAPPQVTANGQPVRPIVGYSSPEIAVLSDPGSGLGTSSNPALNVDTAAARATLTNARNYTTIYAVDRFGAATRIQEPLGRTTSITRDSNSAVLRYGSPSGDVTKYTWSGPDLTVASDSMTGRTDSVSYTGHRVTTVHGNVDSLVNHWTGGSLDSTHIGGAGWTKFSYGTDGRACGYVDPGGHTATCSFASAGGFWNTDSIQYTLGTVRYQYDGHGQRVKAINQVHDTTQTMYDAIGRVVTTVGPLHDTTRFFYDDSMYLTRVQDAKRHVYQAWPNALGWPDSTKDPSGSMDHFQYDLNGNRISWTNRNGQTITYTYDSLDQLRSVVADGKTTTFFANPAGRYFVTANGESTDTVKIDVAGRDSINLSCRTLAPGNIQCFRDSSAYETTSSPYGSRDLRTLTGLSAPGVPGSPQFLVGHHYDVHTFLDTLTPARVSTQSGQPISFIYSAEAMDSVRTLTGLNNLAITHSYPWTHRTDQVEPSNSSLSAALGTAYSFDSAGHLAIRYHGSLSNPDTTRSFAYDKAGNLVQYADTTHHYQSSCIWTCYGWYCSGTDQKSPIGSTTYTYDSVGNGTDPSAPNGGIDVGNRLRRWQNMRMDYDAAGNMTAKRTLRPTDTTKVLRIDSLFWSSLGRLDSVRTYSLDTLNGLDTLTSRVGFGYDGWGRRVRKSTANATSRYVWDGDSLLAQFDTLGNSVAVYTYYPAMDNVASVLRHDRGDSTYYYVQDYSMNVLALLAPTSTGTTIDNQYRYDPFGNVQGSGSNAVPNTLQFAGREYDAETQLYYDRARYIDPSIGRFVSGDPYGLAGGINAYTFVGNDPVNGWDPSGMCQDFKDTGLGLSEHLIIGSALVWGASRIHEIVPLYPAFPSALDALATAAAIGFVHETADRDLTDAKKGAPCNGLIDMLAFVAGTGAALLWEKILPMLPVVLNPNAYPLVIIENPVPIPLYPDPGSFPSW